MFPGRFVAGNVIANDRGDIRWYVVGRGAHPDRDCSRRMIPDVDCSSANVSGKTDDLQLEGRVAEVLEIGSCPVQQLGLWHD
jgi:hypothetical protein